MYPMLCEEDESPFAMENVCGLKILNMQTTLLDDLRAYIRDLFQELREDLRELFRETRLPMHDHRDDVRTVLDRVVGAPLGMDASEDDTCSNISYSEVIEVNIWSEFGCFESGLLSDGKVANYEAQILQRGQQIVYRSMSDMPRYVSDTLI
ncbi:hypothetical protein Dsin_012764 [Dipteronia sinensis]|uniref:Uncharacterized protein n=1 Tax=Dipteronia sinensis TaxID=43782 RepID=A0AAE0AJW7_9ROSI|nr:hypothetical protein Dsin_012764 [Dipteronia sinensis]